MRILVIEDDSALASYVRKGLESEHYAVDIALDGEQGARMASDLDYDLLLLDLNLPKLDGIAVLRSVRPGRPQLPVLVLTGRQRVEDRVHALDNGADDCINKPFSYSELSARVRALLRRGRPSIESTLQVADLHLDRVGTKGRARRTQHRADCQGVRSARIPDAQCRPPHHPLHDHRACLEYQLRYLHQRRRRLH